MIDLTNYNHRRGVMVLNSKDVRTVDENLFDCKIKLNMIDTYLSIVRDRVSKWDIDESSKKATLQDIDFIVKDLEEANKRIDKARDIFR